MVTKTIFILVLTAMILLFCPNITMAGDNNRLYPGQVMPANRQRPGFAYGAAKIKLKEPIAVQPSLEKGTSANPPTHGSVFINPPLITDVDKNGLHNLNRLKQGGRDEAARILSGTMNVESRQIDDIWNKYGYAPIATVGMNAAKYEAERIGYHINRSYTYGEYVGLRRGGDRSEPGIEIDTESESGDIQSKLVFNWAKSEMDSNRVFLHRNKEGKIAVVIMLATGKEIKRLTIDSALINGVYIPRSDTAAGMRAYHPYPANIK